MTFDDYVDHIKDAATFAEDDDLVGDDIHHIECDMGDDCWCGVTQ